jgi:hypothetical protein
MSEYSRERPNHMLQRFEGFGKPREGFAEGKGLANSQTERVGTREPTVPRRERRGCNPCVPRAGSLSLGLADFTRA